MTTPTQREVRAWARARDMKVSPRGSLSPAVMKAYAKAQRDAVPRTPTATVTAGNATKEAVPVVADSARLAAGLRGFLDAIDHEVRAVSSLSERIDGLVTELNALRDEQSNRLLMLDELQAAASDASLQAFLTKAIKPRKTRVAELVPERLQ